MQTKVNILEKIKKERLLFDGGTGTVLADKYGFTRPPEWANLVCPDTVRALHLDYLRAGADIIKTNTFGATRLKHPEKYRDMIRSAMREARCAVEENGGGYIAFDVGPLGRLLKPLGDLDFEEAVSVFRDGISVGAAEGCDLILIETVNDILETKAAVIAAREVCDLPVFVTNVYGSDGKTLTGSSPCEMITLLEGMGVDAIGMNCSLGPSEMLKLVPEFTSAASVPIIVNPNAGLPEYRDGLTEYATTPEEFATIMERIARLGGGLLGGCCGTTPDYIRQMGERVRKIPYHYPKKKNFCRVCSYSVTLDIDHRPIIVGERINPTGKSRIKSALISKDYSYILDQAVAQEQEGAHALDVNAGLPDIDEANTLGELTTLISSVTSLPLQLDSSSPAALEAAMRVYPGKPLVNSVSGDRESLDGVLPLVKKYGGVLIALTMDEDGIPTDAMGRVKIAQKILLEADRVGIPRCDIIFDPLTLTVASGADNARVTLDAVRMFHSMGYRTSLGVSNVSFGLPERDAVNSAFFTAALFSGLSMAIINPHSAAMMNAYRAYLALSGIDVGCEEYIERVIPVSKNSPIKTEKMAQGEQNSPSRLEGALLHGLCDGAREAVSELLSEGCDPMQIINGTLIPVLDRVGEDYGAGRAYLPSLLRTAESASAAFSVLRLAMPRAESEGAPAVVLATVKGDIHDIGKNIVRLIMESYGYRVIDLGRDVAPERIVDAVKEHSPLAVGLSALMTTTLPAMEETVSKLKASFPELPVIVGGAVLTETYAKSIGADHYSPDATEVIGYLGSLG